MYLGRVLWLCLLPLTSVAKTSLDTSAISPPLLNFYACFDTELSEEERYSKINIAKEKFSSIKNDSTLAIYTLLTIFEVKLSPSTDGINELDSLAKIVERRLAVTTSNALLHLSYGVLGVEICLVSDFKRFIAKLFYRPLPENFTFEKSLIHLLKAKLESFSLQPMIHYYLSKSYTGVYNYAWTIFSLKKATSKKNKLPFIDNYYKKLASEKLKTLSF